MCLLAEPSSDGAAKPAQSATEYLRAEYLTDAEKYEFGSGDEQAQRLELVAKPVMTWANDDDWSGDVFVWMHKGQPAVIGSILAGPAGTANRNVFHEFHLLAEKPIAGADLQTHRRWQPAEGLVRTIITDAPKPAANAPARLTQMRQLSREFSAHMEASGAWELRLLTQPLFRYGDAHGSVVDGALFAYVWTKGTDPEVILMLECHKTDAGLAWLYAPVRFSNRSVWMRRQAREIWRVESHKEPSDKNTTLLYTTAYARTMPRAAPPAEAPASQVLPQP